VENHFAHPARIVLFALWRMMQIENFSIGFASDYGDQNPFTYFSVDL
jgi:hypothetical protein